MPPPHVLSNLLDNWIRGTGVCPMGDLDAGLRWTRRLQRDWRLRERLCGGGGRPRNGRKRIRSATPTLRQQEMALQEKSGGLRNTILLDTQAAADSGISLEGNVRPEHKQTDENETIARRLSAADSNNRQLFIDESNQAWDVKDFLKSIEMTVARSIVVRQASNKKRIEEPAGDEGVSIKDHDRKGDSEENHRDEASVVPACCFEAPTAAGSTSPPAVMSPHSAEVEINRLFPLLVGLRSAGVPTRLSATEDATRSQFNGLDRLLRFEKQLVSNYRKTWLAQATAAACWDNLGVSPSKM